MDMMVKIVMWRSSSIELVGCWCLAFRVKS